MYAFYDSLIKYTSRYCWLQVKTTKQLLAEEKERKALGVWTQTDSEPSCEEKLRADVVDADKAEDDKLSSPAVSPPVAVLDPNLRGPSPPVRSLPGPSLQGPVLKLLEERNSLTLRHLRVEHFLELYGGLRLNLEINPRHTIYGLYMVNGHIYLTSLKVTTDSVQHVPNGMDAKALYPFALGMFLKATSKLDRENVARRCKCQLKYKMICTKKFLDLFNPMHMAALFWYVEYIGSIESGKVFPFES